MNGLKPAPIDVKPTTVEVLVAVAVGTDPFEVWPKHHNAVRRKLRNLQARGLVRTVFPLGEMITLDGHKHVTKLLAEGVITEENVVGEL